MHATKTDLNITPQKIWKKGKNDTNSPTHKTLAGAKRNGG
jgi:hypothetical protein